MKKFIHCQVAIVVFYIIFFLKMTASHEPKDQQQEATEVTFKYSNRDFLSGETVFISKLNLSTLKGWRENAPLKIITHGWLNSINSPAVDAIKTAYLQIFDFNIIMVDWSKYAMNIFYPEEIGKVEDVGIFVAQLIDELIMKFLAQLDKIHLIGHSLGAHLMGMAGSRVKTGIPGRITALDPAGPGFNKKNNHTLSTSDAVFVDCIHTTTLIGLAKSVGHVDFWVNKLTLLQPGCDDIACSHLMAVLYYADSIINQHLLKAWKCDNWESFKKGLCKLNSTVYMGDETPNSARGDYFLLTNKSPPYGKDDNNDTDEDYIIT